MIFREGDPVMHWTYGLGKIMRLEVRNISGRNLPYYAVQIGDMTVWVPADGMLENRLRPPTSKERFTDLLAILSGAGDPLPENSHERKTLLMELLRDGHAESLCQVIRGLTAYQRVHQLNDTDHGLLKRAKSALFGEWSFALSVTPAQAEFELHCLLSSGATGD
jgi:RNA polymerase-interacting CarD/CdnL/TRCF family regulator